eukprot:TRINITY_DN1468_c0_g3_i1.p1 TRINITY_DN1468_c0_g3~~TRINITY_DN1468_c0_g3_i1.p1  ORF type:complete len:196 (-),score=25.44 TRINITY_DN1468_c0_g3_i1:207-794(-)
MNFSTDLPKSSPMVNYIVASAIRCSRSTSGKLRDLPCFRMHVVVLKDAGNLRQCLLARQAALNGGKGLILCHIRQVAAIHEDSHSPSRSYIEGIENNGRVGNSQIVVDECSNTPLLNPAKPIPESSRRNQPDTLKSQGIFPLKRGIPMEKIEKAKVHYGYFHSSMVLMQRISECGTSSYQELYKELLERSQCDLP